MINALIHKATEAEGTESIQKLKKSTALLHDICHHVRLTHQMPRLVKRITERTQHTLFAIASSVLLYDDQQQELVFAFASSDVSKEVSKQLRRVKLGAESGIAGWVARHGKPLIANNVNKDRRFNKFVDEITGFVTWSIICAPMLVNGKVLGVMEVINKLDGSDFTKQDLETLMTVATNVALVIDNGRLNKTIAASHKDANNTLDMYKGTVKALAAAIDEKDPYAFGHSRRVAEYALMGATSLFLPKEELEVIEYAGTLHDVGKINIADSVLIKHGPLDDADWKVIREHPVTGYNILKEIPLLERARKLVLRHHEKYDGSGYPDGLKGEAIPMGARLISVADAFDFLVTDHAHRNASSVKEAIEELKKYSGTQFCPKAVKAFLAGFYKSHFRRKA